MSVYASLKAKAAAESVSVNSAIVKSVKRWVYESIAESDLDRSMIYKTHRRAEENGRRIELFMLLFYSWLQMYFVDFVFPGKEEGEAA